MQYCIDTNSLLYLARYYAPFDRDGTLAKFMESNFANGTFKLLAAVYEEAYNIQGGEIIEIYAFLKNVKKTSSLIAEEKHHIKLEQSWSAPKRRDKLTREQQFEKAKEDYVRNADFQLIAYCLDNTENRTLVTEETTKDNDGKPFKKIPVICQSEGIRCITIVRLLKDMGVEVDYRVSTPSLTLSYPQNPRHSPDTA